MVAFIDREKELQELRHIAESSRPAIALLYGRRRVGKTYLLSHAWSGRRVFYFLAADVTPELNRAELIRELSTWTGQMLDPSDFPSWRSVFRELVELAEREPLIVVLDEFSYLMGHGDDIVSQLVAVWDREVRDRPLLLALSGSEVSTMEQLQHGGQPLYGRPAWSARLHPFDYRDTARMVPDRRPREAATVYGIFGGTPRFLAAIPAGEPLPEVVARTILSPRGEVHLQLEHIVEQEKGIRDPAEYRAVLAAVADGETELNEIAFAAGMGERPHAVRRILGILEDLDLIARERNFDAPETSPFRYRIADHAVRFWYRFVHRYRTQLQSRDPGELWRQQVAPHLDTYLGRVFETICREALLRYHARWGLSGPIRWARWEGRDRHRRSIEIDLVAALDDGRFLTGEVKWSSRPVDPEIHRDLVRDLEDLSQSGQRWAHQALAPHRSAGYIYFSAAGFTDGFRRLAAEDPRIRLVTLDDCYPDE